MMIKGWYCCYVYHYLSYSYRYAMVKALIHGGGCASQGGKVVYKDKEKGSGLSDHPDCYSSSSSHNTSQASHILYDPHMNGNVVCALAVGIHYLIIIISCLLLLLLRL